MNKIMKLYRASKMKRFSIAILTAILFTYTGCDYFENSDSLNSATLEVNLTGLPFLPDSMTYVCWIDQDVAGFKPIFAFAQDPDVNGNLNYKSETRLGYLKEAQILKITIEPESSLNDSSFQPSSRVLFSGRLKTGNTTFDIGPAANQLNDIAGKYSLVTPTDTVSTNELSGIWFVDSLLTASSPVAGLNLPELYGGWIYEGWIEINGTLVSTGRFTNPDASDLSKKYSSTLAGFSFPGEDFLVNAPTGLTFPTDLSGQKVYISIERKDGNLTGIEPFAILLSATIQSPAQANVTYELQKTNNVIPSGSAVIKADLFE